MPPSPVASVITREVHPFIAVVAAVAATALFAAPASAQPDEEPVHLEYHAPSACDDDAQFFARARSRAPRMRVARPEERARVFVVEIEQRAGRMHGRLTVRNREGRQTVREIEAKDCNEAVDALALVVALVINPRAGAQGAPTGAPSESEPSPAAPASPPSAPHSSVPTAPASSAPNAPAAPKTSPDPSRPAGPSSALVAPAAATDAGSEGVTSARLEPLWGFRAGAGAWGVGAIAPEPLLGARITAELLDLRSNVMAPSFRLSAGYATHAGFVVDGGTAHFSYGGANIQICPLRIPQRGPLVLRPCVMADAGFVLARGSDAFNARSETRPWADVGVGGRLEWSLGRRVAVEVDAGCMFPIWRDRFLFGTRSFHRVALAGGVVALGFVMRIP
jgi:hypothetical protein